MHTRACLSTTLLLGALLVVPDLAAQQVTGRVTNSQTGEPLGAVQVFIAGSGIGALSQQNGRFLLLNVPPGTHTLSAERIGYRAATRQVSVTAGQTVVVDFAMAEEALMSIHDFPKPTLACIRGYCIGGGVNVAISCDIRIAAEDAVFSSPAARLGLGYRYSAMKNLVDLIGPGAAKDLFFTARRIDAGEAKALGLVTRVSAPAALDKLLAEYTDAIAENAPLTIAAGKAITREILKPSPELDQALCASLIRGCFECADYTEGRTAFLQNRKPVFTGR